MRIKVISLINWLNWHLFLVLQVNIFCLSLTFIFVFVIEALGLLVAKTLWGAQGRHILGLGDH